jgi:hypothetical protein
MTPTIALPEIAASAAGHKRGAPGFTSAFQGLG